MGHEDITLTRELYAQAGDEIKQRANEAVAARLRDQRARDEGAMADSPVRPYAAVTYRLNWGNALRKDVFGDDGLHERVRVVGGLRRPSADRRRRSYIPANVGELGWPRDRRAMQPGLSRGSPVLSALERCESGFPSGDTGSGLAVGADVAAGVHERTRVPVQPHR